MPRCSVAIACTKDNFFKQISKKLKGIKSEITARERERDGSDLESDEGIRDSNEERRVRRDREDKGERFGVLG